MGLNKEIELDYSSNSLDDLSIIYKPNDDTYILLEYLLININKDKYLKNILEIGTGSGFITKQLKEKFPFNFYLQTDINSNVPIFDNFILADLLKPIKQNKIDLCFFNPPYVPTKYIYKGYKASYAGGKEGIEIINRFIDSIKIKEVIILVIEINKPNEIIKRFKNKGYKKVEIVMKRKIMKEVIYLIKAIW